MSAHRELYQITAPHFVAGLVVDRVENVTRVVQAAPILGWAIGKKWADVIPYFKRKKWEWLYVGGGY